MLTCCCYIGRFVISEGSLYLEVHDIRRIGISGGSLIQEVRYVGRFVISGGSSTTDFCYTGRPHSVLNTRSTVDAVAQFSEDVSL